MNEHVFSLKATITDFKEESAKLFIVFWTSEMPLAHYLMIMMRQYSSVRSMLTS